MGKIIKKNLRLKFYIINNKKLNIYFQKYIYNFFKIKLKLLIKNIVKIKINYKD